MPQLNSSSSAGSNRKVTSDDSKKETKTETGPYRRKLRTRAKNQKSESPEKIEEKPEELEEVEEPEKPEKKPAKKAAKRKQPIEKKPAAKSPKSRGPKKKAGQAEPTSENVQKKVQQSVVKIEQNFDDDEDDEDMEEGEIPSSIAAETKTYYSCKLCHKDFSSAFILCLHLQIHQKVANTKVNEEDSTERIEDEIQNGSIKLEPVEEADENVKTDEEESEPTVIKVENSPATGAINKNFVENLKRNLSLAMAKNNS